MSFSLQGGRYQVGAILGQGGSSRVYAGQHQELLRPVALKCLHSQEPADIELFREEARLLAALNHPRIVTVYDFFLEGSQAWMVLEQVEGRTLYDQVQLEHPVVLQRCLQWLDELLDLLEFLHHQQPPVILKDLKPENVMVRQDGHLMLLDFGIAKRLTPLGTQPLNKGMGSEHYAPLEQYGQGSTDQRSDLYALGCTLFYMLTGQEPTPAHQRLRHSEPLRPEVGRPELEPALLEALRQMTALFPQDRPAHVARVRQLLKERPAPRGDYLLRPPEMAQARTVIERPSLEVRRLGEWKAMVRQARFSAEGELWALTDQGLVCFKPGRPPKSLWKGEALALALSPEGRRWAVLGRDGQCFYPRREREGRLRLEGAEGARWLAWGPDSQWLCLAQAQRLTSHQGSDGKLLHTFPAQGWWQSLMGFRFVSCATRGHLLVAGGSDGSLWCWDVLSGRRLWQAHRPGPARSLAIDPEGRLLVSSSEASGLSLWELESGRNLQEIPEQKGWDGLHWSQDGRFLLGGLEQEVRCWDLPRQSLALTLTTPSPLQGCAFAGSQLAFWGADSLQLWER